MLTDGNGKVFDRIEMKKAPSRMQPITIRDFHRRSGRTVR